jgi:hypothetical protein
MDDKNGETAASSVEEAYLGGESTVESQEESEHPHKWRPLRKWICISIVSYGEFIM